MKRLLFLLLICLPINTSAVELSIVPLHLMYQSDNIDNDTGLRLQLGHDNYYLWATLESPLLRFGGQQCIDIETIGVGLGVRTKSYSGFSLFLDGGYYLTSYDTLEAFHHDGAWFAFAEHLIWQDGTAMQRTHWDRYGYELKNGFGGSIGVSYSKSFLNDHLRLGFMVGYRYLRLNQSIYGWDGEFDPTQPHWEVFRYQDFSGVYSGISVTGKY